MPKACILLAWSHFDLPTIPTTTNEQFSFRSSWLKEIVDEMLTTVLVCLTPHFRVYPGKSRCNSPSFPFLLEIVYNFLEQLF